ncbi:MAG: VCBS repeat-containing protein [Phycisphaerales bacterium]|nr:VCBS repeat-containing protein [Phycisphaerales bacterium]
MTYPYGMAAADFLDASGLPGQDGFPELAVAGAGWDTLECDGEQLGSIIRVLRNTGSWDTDPAAGFAFDWATNIAPVFATELAFADVSGQNGPDLVLLGYLPGGPLGVMMVFENLGNGEFDYDAQMWITPFATLRGLVAADADNDGDIDIIAAADDCNFTSDPRDYFVVFENISVGGILAFEDTARAMGVSEAVAPGDICAGDYFVGQPGQALTDFVCPDPLADEITVVENLGGLQFGFTNLARPTGCGTGAWLFDTIAGGRFGADSDLDFAAVNREDRVVGVFLGDSAGGFQSPCENSSLEYTLFSALGTVKARGIATARLNGGNNTDLVVALDNPVPDPILAPWKGAVGVLLGRPNGTFQSPSASQAYIFELGSPIAGPATVQIADLNNDGFDDIITANFYSDNISVLINRMLVVSP